MNEPSERPRPVAVSDIAVLLGVSVNTVNQWRKRAASAVRVAPFPPAAGKVAKTDYWWEDEILDWAEKSGRRKTPPADAGEQSFTPTPPAAP